MNVGELIEELSKWDKTLKLNFYRRYNDGDWCEDPENLDRGVTINLDPYDNKVLDVCSYGGSK